MILEQQYAQALHKARSSQGPATELFANLAAALKRRGHMQLLPRIVSAYQKIAAQETRLEEYTKVTPERERTRVLVELYTKLVRSTK
ncbi:MAG: hypothetical protein AAB449_02250 [Patescibacteria group bacterium]